jgi:hypothetical protein
VGVFLIIAAAQEDTGCPTMASGLAPFETLLHRLSTARLKSYLAPDELKPLVQKLCPNDVEAALDQALDMVTKELRRRRS